MAQSESESWSTPARIEAEVRRLQAEIRAAGERAALLAGYRAAVGEDSDNGYRAAVGEDSDNGYRPAVSEGNGAGYRPAVSEGSDNSYRAAVGEGNDSGYRAAVGEDSDNGYRPAVSEGSDNSYRAAVGEGNGAGYRAAVSEGSDNGYRAAVGRGSDNGYRATVGEGSSGADYRAAVGAVTAATRALVEYEAAISDLQAGYRRHLSARITRWSGGLLALVGVAGGIAAGCGALAFWWLFPSIALAAAGLLNTAGTRRRAADPALRPRIGAACFAVAGIVAAVCAVRLLPPAALLVAFVACWVGLYAFRLLGAAPAPEAEAAQTREAR